VRPPPSNAAKAGQALAFAAVAGAAQVALAAAEQNAKNNAPVTRSTTGAMSPGCDNNGQYACLSVAPPPSAPDAPEPEMSEDDAHDYVLAYVNGVRKLNGVGPLVPDASLDAFARAGSDELAQDHLPNRHLLDHARELQARSAEVQGSPEGARPGPLQERIADYLLRWMGEGPGGMHHDTMLHPEWRKLGVGIVSRADRMYLTVDFSN
jgi:uncharacterized protein YkwD